MVIVDEVKIDFMKILLVISFVFSCLITNAQAKPHRDSIKIIVPKDKSFNPSNSKLRNSKIKTPVYNNNLTGTNAPGDVNTGIPADNSNHRPTGNAALDKLKDSTKPNK